MKIFLWVAVIVCLLLGKDKGKIGVIEKVLPSQDKVLVAEVNQFKKHIKGRTQGQKSEIVVITKPIQASKVALVCPACKKPTRVGYEVRNELKVRVCRKCDSTI
jgi:large subunit ribosomal protein L24